MTEENKMSKNATSTNGTAANEPKFRPGDRVVRVTSSEIPEGVKGTVLQACPNGCRAEGRWEVEYDGHPCTQYSRANAHPWAKSPTSWFSRETSIELTVDEVRRRIANGR